MFLSQQVEEVKSPQGHVGFKLTVWRVEFNPAGIPVWKMNGEQGGVHWAMYANIPGRLKQAKRYARECGLRHVPFMPGVSSQKPVTNAECLKLTGVGIVDYLYEDDVAAKVNDRTTIHNYVKPKKVKEPKPEPCPVQVALGEAERCEAQAEHYRRRLKRIQNLVKKWEGKARRYARKADQLQNSPAAE